MPSSPVLSKILKGNLCSGCGACASIAEDAVAMQVSPEGFLRPAQTSDLSTDEEKAITAICPGLGYSQASGAGTGDDHPIWGPVTSMHQGHATDEGLRYRGASGGGLSALLLHLLDSGLVDEVLQVAADEDVPFANLTVSSTDREGIHAAAGSRYAPSAPLADIETALNSDRRYAFVGKPCDVAALRAMARLDDRVDQRIPYMLSFFCAGVPSLDGARNVVAALGVDETDLAAFRYRGDGWPGFATATRKDGTQRKMSYSDSWGGILSKHVQFRCKVCPDGTGGAADAVCADAWETDEAGYPTFTEREGISLIVARNEKGEELVRSALSAKAIDAEPFNAANLAKMQPGQLGKRRYTFARLAALAVLFRPMPRFRGFHLWANSMQAGLKPNLRNFLGTLRRAVLGRL